MDATIKARLEELGIELVEQKGLPHFLGFTRSGDTLYFSGKTAIAGGKVVHAGQLDSADDIELGRQAAKLCAVNLLSAIESAVGLEQVESVLKMTAFVASTANFHRQSDVVNAASELFVDVLGEAGQHARSAVGVSALPGNSAVEIELIVRVRGESS